MRNLYLLALLVLIGMLLTGCANIVKYDKGYHEVDTASVSQTTQGIKSNDPPIHSDEVFDLTNTSENEDIVTDAHA